MTKLFGRSYNDIGSSNADLILKTKGLIKILWGNKFIDLIKNGKINSDSGSLINTVNTLDDIGSNNGFYYVLEDLSLWVVIGDQKINLKGEIGTTYVSFLGPQETTGEQKYTALTNIGFIYPSLEEALAAGLPNGIVYLLDIQKMYIVVNGELSEYQFDFPNPFPEQLVISKVDNATDGALIIEGNGLSNGILLEGTLIYYDEGTVINNTLNKFRILLNSKDTIIIQNDITVNNKTTFKDSIESNKILSIGAGEGLGFRLYMLGLESYLEVDNIITKTSSSKYILPSYYSSKNNTIYKVITDLYSQSLEGVQEEGTLLLLLTTKNEYLVGDLLYVYAPMKTYIVDEGVQIETDTVDLKKLLLTVTESDVDSGIITVSYDSDNINELNLTLLVGQTIFLLNRPGEPNKLIRYSLGNIDLLECTSLEEEENLNSISTRVGNLQELSISATISQDGKSESITPLLGNIAQGIYSKLFISDNSLQFNANLYAPVFRGGLGKNIYPRYEDNFNIPLEDDSKTIVTSEWVKDLLNSIIPKGTIVMWSGTTIPDGWAICDGNNGTPNLINKFIKASTTPNETGGSNQVTLTEENLPSHSHSLELVGVNIDSAGNHTHLLNWYTFIGESDDANDRYVVRHSNTADYVDSDSSHIRIAESGEHTHTASLTANLTGSVGGGQQFDILPEYYTLIFIMKLM